MRNRPWKHAAKVDRAAEKDHVVGTNRAVERSHVTEKGRASETNRPVETCRGPETGRTTQGRSASAHLAEDRSAAGFVTEDRSAEGPTVEGRHVEHTCARPSWECRACGLPWPCAPAKVSLADGADRVMLMMYMWGHLDHAMTELSPRPPAEMFDRFLSWTDAELVQA
ncbi:hypothetical protein GCM10009828_017230 [Actinoplanes couchii]|uniref:Uncharacterized protein n=1 Tax=Actinoplanes couchii TaxID=403638 RepID=A0ABQ3X4M3_9ACTN|nr:hypothetical protein Aco03nite_018380 [Actinoplanes couchii]